jgi:hypothetical protein
MIEEEYDRKKAISFLGIPEKNFDNYVKSSKEIKHHKKSRRYYFKKNELERWKNLRKNRTVELSMKEYQKCFVLAIQMAYTKKSSAGTGIRGVRSEMQTADDWILGILAEFALQKFVKDKFNKKIELDTEPHPKEGITAQDIVTINGRLPQLKVGMKASKEKNCWIVLDALEYENKKRMSDIYIFARVELPSDHLFRILREHSFFDEARKKLDSRVEKQEKTISKISEQIKKKIEERDRLGKKCKKMTPGILKNKIKNKIKSIKNEIKEFEQTGKKSKVFRNIMPLPKQIPIWLCGYTEHIDFKKTNSIPGQEFSGDRYVQSVSEMRNSDNDWKEFIEKL